MAETGGRILVVDDNVRLLHVLRTSLEQEGHDVRTAEDGDAAVRIAAEWRPDVVILDILMPGLNGWAACDRLRRVCAAPVIFLTVRDSEDDVVRGLSVGAEGYLTKPFSLAELKARVEALLRRAGEGGRAERRTLYSDGTLTVDLARGSVTRRGEEVALSPKEYQLLALLVRRQGEVVPHDELLREVWGRGYEEERAYLAIYIRYLREKIEDDPANPRYVHTHHGVGYRFGPPEPPA